MDTKYFWMGVFFGVVLILLLPQLARATVNTNLPSLPLSQVARSWTDLRSLDEDEDGLIDVSAVKQGPGSGFDADTVDGYHASDLLAAASGPAYVNFDENAPYLVDFGDKNLEYCKFKQTHQYCFNEVGPIPGFTYTHFHIYGYGSPGKSFVVGHTSPTGSDSWYAAYCIVKEGGYIRCSGYFDNNNVIAKALYVGRVVARFYKKAAYVVEYNVQLTFPDYLTYCGDYANTEFTVNILEFCGDVAPTKISAAEVSGESGSGVYVGRLEVNRQYYSPHPPTAVFSATGSTTYSTRCDSGYLVIAAFFVHQCNNLPGLLLDDSYVNGRILAAH